MHEVIVMTAAFAPVTIGILVGMWQAMHDPSTQDQRRKWFR